MDRLKQLLLEIEEDSTIRKSLWWVQNPIATILNLFPWGMPEQFHKLKESADRETWPVCQRVLAIAQKHGIEFLGTGAMRTVWGTKERVWKIPVSSKKNMANRHELESWDCINQTSAKWWFLPPLASFTLWDREIIEYPRIDFTPYTLKDKEGLTVGELLEKLVVDFPWWNLYVESIGRIISDSHLGNFGFINEVPFVIDYESISVLNTYLLDSLPYPVDPKSQEQSFRRLFERELALAPTIDETKSSA